MPSADEKSMRLAIRAARMGMEKGQSPFGACIVKAGKPIACVHNSVWKAKDITAHAEVRAIRNACRKLGTIDLSGCTIYSTCEPCPMCFSAIHWAKIQRIAYGTSITDAKKIGFAELEIPNSTMKRMGKSRIILQGGIMKGECLRLFSEFLARGGKKRLY